MTEVEALREVLKLNSYLVPHTKFQSAIDNMQRAMRSCQAARIDGLIHDNYKPMNVLLLGEAGTGKTTAAKDIGNSQKSQRIDGKGYKKLIVPSFYSKVSNPVTIKGVAIQILTQLNDPDPNFGTVYQMTSRIVALLAACETNLIILDEFHHLLSSSRSNLNEVRNWIKTLADDSRVPIVLAGLPECEALLDSDHQLKRRFNLRTKLENLKKDPANGTKGEFGTFIRQMLKAAKHEFKFESVCLFDDIESYRQLFVATGGNPDDILTLFERAIVNVLIQDKHVLTLEDIKEAYSNLTLSYSLIQDANPFEMNAKALLIAMHMQ